MKKLLKAYVEAFKTSKMKVYLEAEVSRLSGLLQEFKFAEESLDTLLFNNACCRMFFFIEAR